MLVYPDCLGLHVGRSDLFSSDSIQDFDVFEIDEFASPFVPTHRNAREHSLIAAWPIVVPIR